MALKMYLSACHAIVCIFGRGLVAEGLIQNLGKIVDFMRTFLILLLSMYEL